MAAPNTTLRRALRQIRAETEGRDYLPGPVEYDCDQGVLLVRNAPASGGGSLLGVFEAELISRTGQTVRRYRV